MAEVWLRPNRRVLLISLIPAGGIGVVGVLLIAAAESSAVRLLGWVLAVAGAVLAIGLINQLRRPRISYHDGEVLFHLRAGRPVATPVEAVEAFFLGQGPAHLPATGGKETETVNLVARLSQKHPQWAQVDVKRALGQWCNGYATIRGTWCEPLNGDVVRRLNRRLREVSETPSGAAAQSPPPADAPERLR